MKTENQSILRRLLNVLIAWLSFAIFFMPGVTALFLLITYETLVKDAAGHWFFDWIDNSMDSIGNVISYLMGKRDSIN